MASTPLPPGRKGRGGEGRRLGSRAVLRWALASSCLCWVARPAVSGCCLRAPGRGFPGAVSPVHGQGLASPFPGPRQLQWRLGR